MSLIDKDLFIEASPEDVFIELTDTDRLRRWMAITSRVDLRAGGEYRFTVVPGNNACGTFTEVEPGRRLAYTWGWEGNDVVPVGSSKVTVDLEPEGEGTRLRFRHEGLPDGEQTDMHSDGWDHYLERLQAVAAKGDAGFDEWMAGPEELDPLAAAEASWALTQRVVREFSTDDRERATACSDFTVHDLVEHLMGSLRAVGTAAGGAEIDAPQTSAEDYLAAQTQSSIESLRTRGLEGTLKLGDHDLPAEFAARILAMELFVHGWDFADATGQPFEPADHLTAFIDESVHMAVGPGRRDAFAAEVPTSDGATPLARLIAFSGRMPVGAA